MQKIFHIASAVAVDALLLIRLVILTIPLLLLRLFLQQPADSKKSYPYLLMLSFIEWDVAWQRPQHLAQHASRGMDVVCCAPVRAHNLSPLRAWKILFNARESLSKSLTVLRPLLLPAENRFAFVRFLNSLILFDQLQAEIRLRGHAPEVLLTNSPFFSLPFTWLPAKVRAYDVMDELIRFPWAPRNAADLERQVVEQCDVVTTGTKSLSKLKTLQYADLKCEARYVSLGVDAGHFASGGPTPPDMAELPRPIIGFFGALNERIDPQVIEALSEGIPEGSVVLIGPQYERFASLSNRPNVHFLGLKPYSALPAYLAAFDCAIIPYRLTNGIEFVQPVKVLEYLAGGKPVVSTAIPDVVDLYSSLVRIGKDPQDFVRLTREAVAEGSDRSSEYAAAGKRTWHDMADDFLGLFQKAAENKKSKPRTVTHLLHGIHYGGAEQLVVDLCRCYDGNQFSGSVVCLGHGLLMQQQLSRAGIPGRIVEMKSRWNLAVVFSLIRALRALKTDLIHTHTSRTNLLGRVVTRLTGMPTITTIHTAIARDINDLGRSNRINAWIERHTQNWSARLVTVSEHNRIETLGTGADPKRVLHIANGVEIPPIDPSAQPASTIRKMRVPTHAEARELKREIGLEESLPVVGMLSSMRPRKGPEVLLLAMLEILKSVPQAHLLMVGSGEFVEQINYLETLKDLARNLGISDKVIFTGHRDDTAAMLSLMDVVTLPSLFGEGMPLVLLEAMALCKPVVATRTEGNDEVVVHNETGYLVPANDSQALGEAILKILMNPETAKSMAQAARVRAEKDFDVRVMTKKYEEVYQEILEKDFV